MAEVTVIKDLDNNKFIIEFVAAGPIDKVWKAYSDKAWFEKWWGPEGWETITKEFNFVPGGKIHYGMKCVDETQGEWYGQESWGVMEIVSVEDGKSFTYRDWFSDDTGTFNKDMPALKSTNEFFDQGGTTRIVCTNYADNAEQIEQLIKMGMVEGFSSQLNKLDKLVA